MELATVPGGGNCKDDGNAGVRARVRGAPPLWFATAAALAFVALLLAFNHVVRQGVQAAHLRHQTAAAQSAALWRCHSVQERQARDGCIAGVPGSSNGMAATVASAYTGF